jgi:hypothetical protein
VLDLILKFVALGSVITGIVAIYIGVLNNNRRLGAQIFLTYADRIFSVRRSLPPESFLSRFGRPDRELTAEERRAVHEALYLVFEFHALRQGRYISRRIWAICEPDMERLLNTPVFDREWPGMREEFSVHPEFIAWVSQKRTKVGAARNVVVSL